MMVFDNQHFRVTAPAVQIKDYYELLARII